MVGEVGGTEELATPITHAEVKKQHNSGKEKQQYRNNTEKKHLRNDKDKLRNKATKGKETREELEVIEGGVAAVGEKARKKLVEKQEVWLKGSCPSSIPRAIVLANTIVQEQEDRVETSSYTESRDQDGRKISVLLIRLRLKLDQGK